MERSANVHGFLFTHSDHVEGDCEACEAFREFADPRSLRTTEIPYETMREVVEGRLA